MGYITEGHHTLESEAVPFKYHLRLESTAAMSKHITFKQQSFTPLKHT